MIHLPNAKRHERLRLGILSVLAVSDTMSFTDLREAMGTTDGNLSVQARRLEDAGYIAAVKEHDERRPRTVYRLTQKGRAALERYVQTIERILPAATGHRAERAPGDLSAATSKA